LLRAVLQKGLNIISLCTAVHDGHAFQPSYMNTPVSSEISDFTPCAHAQINILHIKCAQKTDNYGLEFGV